MATPAVSQALRVPGKLIVNPTDLSTASPYGGTELGLVRDVTFTRTDETRRVIRAGEFGGEFSSVVRGGVGWAGSFGVRGFDADAMAQLFPNTFSAGGDTNLREPGTVQAGMLADDDAVVLLFDPVDATNHPGVLFFKAIPLIAEEVELMFGDAVEIVWAVGFLAVRDDEGRMIETAKISSMSQLLFGYGDSGEGDGDYGGVT